MVVVSPADQAARYRVTSGREEAWRGAIASATPIVTATMPATPATVTTIHRRTSPGILPSQDPADPPRQRAPGGYASADTRGERRRHPTDRRRVHLHLTPEGRRVREEVLPRVLQQEKAWTAPLTKAERAELTDGLARLSDHLRETG